MFQGPCCRREHEARALELYRSALDASAELLQKRVASAESGGPASAGRSAAAGDEQQVRVAAHIASYLRGQLRIVSAARALVAGKEAK